MRYLHLICLLVLSCLCSMGAPVFSVDGVVYTIAADMVHAKVLGINGENNTNQRVSIPEKVNYNGQSYIITEIGAFAFKDCKSLKEVIFEDCDTPLLQNTDPDPTGQTVALESNPFEGCSVERFYFGRPMVADRLRISSEAKNVELVFAQSKASLALEKEGDFKYGTVSITVNPTVKTLDLSLKGVHNIKEFKTIEGSDELYLSSKSMLADCEIAHAILGRPMDNIGLAGAGIDKLTILKNVPYLTMYSFQAGNTCKGIRSLVFEDGNEPFEAHQDRFSSICPKENIAFIFQGCEIDSVYFGRPINGNFKKDDTWYAACYARIKKAVFSSNIKAIPDKFFENVETLESVFLPTSIESIGVSTFYGCSSLREINLPEELKSIGESAFRKSALNKIIIPKSVTTVGVNAFSNCTSLKEFIIEDGEDQLDAYWGWFSGTILESLYIGRPTAKKFQWTTGNIKHLILGPSVKDLPEDFMRDQNILEKITFSEGLTTISDRAFEGCVSLNNCILPRSVETIGERAFSGCSSLESIQLNTGLRTIGRSTFNGSGIKDITIPNTVTSIGECALVSLQLKIIVLEDGILPFEDSFPYLNWFSYTVMDIDSIYFGRPIDKRLFLRDGTKIRKVEFGPSAKDVPSSFLSGNIYLEEVVFPSELNSIKSNAFSDCTSLKHIVWPEVIHIIKNGAFLNCTELTEVNLGKELTSIGETAFYNSGIISIQIPNSLESLGANAFTRCKNLKTLVFEDGPNFLSLIDQKRGSKYTSMFQDCEIDSVYFGRPFECLFSDNQQGKKPIFKHLAFGPFVKEIPNTAFGQISIESVSFAYGVEKINGSFFVTSIREIVLPESVISLGDDAFRSNKNLASFTFSPNIKNIPEYLLYGCPALTHLNIPEGVESIDRMLLSEYDNLKFISLPSTLKSLSTDISQPSFLQLPNSVEIYCYATSVPEIPRENFKDIKVHIPVGTLNAYKLNSQWAKAMLIDDIEVDHTVITKGQTLTFNVPVSEVDADNKVERYEVLCYPLDESGNRLEPERFVFDADGNPVNDEEEMSQTRRVAKEAALRGTFIINGLNANTEYDYEIKGYASDRSLVYAASGSAKTSDVSTSVEEIDFDSVGSDATFFDLNGNRLGCGYESLAPGIYICKTPKGTFKIRK